MLSKWDEDDWHRPAMLAYFAHLEQELPDRSVKLRVSCPMHDDYTPSAVIFPNGLFHCSSCAWTGDVIELVKKTEGKDDSGAFAFVNNELGVATRGATNTNTGGEPVPRHKRADKSGHKYVPPRRRAWGDVG